MPTSSRSRCERGMAWRGDRSPSPFAVSAFPFIIDQSPEYEHVYNSQSIPVDARLIEQEFLSKHPAGAPLHAVLIAIFACTGFPAPAGHRENSHVSFQLKLVFATGLGKLGGASCEDRLEPPRSRPARPAFANS
ncbi:hypothetical protein [Conexibacter sp. CPCC 206217]|uniref:hypothetical protein n=1 Tax=Conexibacter sp. CPCC 206217 TaxID=3064574 RepID=UPI00271E90A7|nr:hypothetical protein [Conexibacter sp. CPCC 206217]MDO8210749.1 hypothetical protein [Conexibacter sp. CPCC 206217]